MFMAHIIPDFHLIDSQKRVSECGFRTFSCAHLTRFKLRTSYLPKSQSHSPVFWSCHISNMEGYSFLTSHSANINVLFRLRIGRCRMDGIRYYRTTSNLLIVEHKVVSSIIWNLRVYVCWLHFPRTHETAAGPIHSVAVSKLFPWCIGLERGVLLPCNIFQLSMHRVYSLPVALPSPRTHDERLMMRTLRGCDRLRNGCGQSARKHNDPFSLIAGLINSYAQLIIYE